MGEDGFCAGVGKLMSQLYDKRLVWLFIFLRSTAFVIEKIKVLFLA
jgi:hypothetical protein